MWTHLSRRTFLNIKVMFLFFKNILNTFLVTKRLLHCMNNLRSWIKTHLVNVRVLLRLEDSWFQLLLFKEKKGMLFEAFLFEKKFVCPGKNFCLIHFGMICKGYLGRNPYVIYIAIQNTIYSNTHYGEQCHNELWIREICHIQKWHKWFDITNFQNRI